MSTKKANLKRSAKDQHLISELRKENRRLRSQIKQRQSDKARLKQALTDLKASKATGGKSLLERAGPGVVERHQYDELSTHFTQTIG